MARILGVALLVAAAAIGATTVANADQIRQQGSLVQDVRGCEATVLVPADQFDPDAPVLVSTAGWEAVVVAGASVVVPVTGGVEVRAAGLHDGRPDELIDTVAATTCPG